MPTEVYANGDAIACKAGDGKVIASFPDVCLSPPSPPAGPIPVPYPDTSFSKDMQNGSKTVKIAGDTVMLKDQSYYATSPLGDEAATRTFGANIMSHVITGKTYFTAWSMDVLIEGQNVDRHTDLTTSNHASYPAGCVTPNPDLEKQALERLQDDACPCCGKKSPACTAALSKTLPNGKAREAYGPREWLRLDETDASGAPTATARDRNSELAKRSCLKTNNCAGKQFPEQPCDVYRVLTKNESDDNEASFTGGQKRLHRDHHNVPKTKGALAASLGIKKADLFAHYQTTSLEEVNEKVKINHRTPRAAGGCPTSTDNTNAYTKLCGNCQEVDKLLDQWSNDELQQRRIALGV